MNLVTFVLGLIPRAGCSFGVSAARRYRHGQITTSQLLVMCFLHRRKFSYSGETILLPSLSFWTVTDRIYAMGYPNSPPVLKKHEQVTRRRTLTVFLIRGRTQSLVVKAPQTEISTLRHWDKEHTDGTFDDLTRMPFPLNRIRHKHFTGAPSSFFTVCSPYFPNTFHHDAKLTGRALCQS
ncbi:MAG: hypothetical protein CM1200mP24_06300 [Gammaproteobacteria bacterium]|nr:MAG: hypothetical protein CM1200mP24_06300 [Gammaproteobacteria bacterium]